MGANWGYYNSPNSWPYTNFHELNLDWILEKLKEQGADTTALQQAISATNSRIDETNSRIDETNSRIDETNNNVSTLSTQNLNTLEVAERGRAVHNYFDNSDFSNPVNQRGITETSKNGYFISRWENYNGASKVTSSGIQVNANKNSAAFLYQYVKGLRDGTYTFAAKVNGNIVLRVIQISGTTVTTIDSTEATYTGGYLAVFYGNDDKFEFNFRVESGATITVEWAALYEGSYTTKTLPAYVPKGYAVEMAECMRYYRPFTTDAIATALNSTTIEASMQLDPPMRIPPTITITSVINAYTPDGIKTLTIGAPSIYTERYASYTFKTETIGAGVPCVVKGINGYLSADL